MSDAFIGPVTRLGKGDAIRKCDANKKTLRGGEYVRRPDVQSSFESCGLCHRVTIDAKALTENLNDGPARTFRQLVLKSDSGADAPDHCSKITAITGKRKAREWLEW
jgi:hypothetical protein